MRPNEAFETIKKTIDTVAPLDAGSIERARERQGRLAKPLGSLGRLEDIAVQIAGIHGRLHNRADKRMLLTFCADNGVIRRGVSVSPKEITLIQAKNLARGITGAGVLARAAGCKVMVYDVGIDGDPDCDYVIDRKISRGTADITETAAMPREDALKAVCTGIEAAESAVAEGMNVIGVGELGIGNTTTAAAVLCALTGASACECTGRGGGLTDEALERKIKAVETALEINSPDRNDVIGVLSKVGGLDICAMCGAFLGAAAKRVPVVIDGFISAVAALCAVRLCPPARQFMLASHGSDEKGFSIAARELEAEPLLDLKMRLGEGSGCPMAMQIADFACLLMNDMATFGQAGIDDGYLSELREKKETPE